MQPYIESFLPLFVAINLPGMLPIFIGLTDGMLPHKRRNLVIQAMTTAFVIALLILFAGQVIFNVLGITVHDLRVGGGLILLILSITDLIFSDMRRRAPDEDDSDSSLGVVPLGIPLVMGPAAITTILVSQQEYGYLPPLVSLLLNLGLAVVVFLYGPPVVERLGAGTAKAVGKVASLFLAAIAVAMIHGGILGMIAAR
jgi:multiple antibiotic resistance protein